MKSTLKNSIVVVILVCATLIVLSILVGECSYLTQKKRLDLFFEENSHFEDKSVIEWVDTVNYNAVSTWRLNLIVRTEEDTVKQFSIIPLDTGRAVDSISTLIHFGDTIAPQQSIIPCLLTSVRLIPIKSDELPSTEVIEDYGYTGLFEGNRGRAVIIEDCVYVVDRKTCFVRKYN